MLVGIAASIIIIALAGLRLMQTSSIQSRGEGAPLETSNLKETGRYDSKASEAPKGIEHRSERSSAQAVAPQIAPEPAEAKPLPVPCGNHPLQPLWGASSDFRVPKWCVDMNGHLVFDNSLGKPTFMVINESTFALTFPTTVGGPVMMAVGPSVYYSVKVENNAVIFDVDAANSVLRYGSAGHPDSPDFNEKQARETFFYFTPTSKIKLKAAPSSSLTTKPIDFRLLLPQVIKDAQQLIGR